MEDIKLKIVGVNKDKNPIYLVCEDYHKLLSDNNIDTNTSFPSPFEKHTDEETKLGILFMSLLKEGNFITHKNKPYCYSAENTKWYISEVKI